MQLRLLDVTSANGTVVEPEWLVRAEAVHRQLRPQIPPDYAAAMARVFAGGGRMAVAIAGAPGDDGAAGRVVGVAVHRTYVNTFEGLQTYVDDLVTDEATRSLGVGRALLAHVEAIAVAAGAVGYNLDSGVQRAAAHKFYFREGFVASAFHFWKPLR